MCIYSSLNTYDQNLIISQLRDFEAGNYVQKIPPFPHLSILLSSLPLPLTSTQSPKIPAKLLSDYETSAQNNEDYYFYKLQNH